MPANIARSKPGVDSLGEHAQPFAGVAALRHSSIKITNDTYGHLIGTVGRDAAEAAAALVPLRSRKTA
jgi:hypothetical protein